MIRSLASAIAALLLSATAAANPVACQHSEAPPRSVEVVYVNPGDVVPCEVIYSKDGGKRSLYRAQNEAGYCEARAAEFIDKLRGWGWQCADDSGEPDTGDTP